jgi:hypothetical protein
MLLLGVLQAQAAGGPAPSGPSFDLLETQVLDSAESSVTFSSLSTYAADYKHLQIRTLVRGTQATTIIGLRAQLGTGATPDSGSNYASHQLEGINGSVSSGAFTNQTFFQCGVSSGSSSTTDAFAGGVIDILDAFNTNKNKTIRTLSGVAQATNAIVKFDSAHWRDTGAINLIRLFTSGDLNFAIGSRFSLYGSKAGS